MCIRDRYLYPSFGNVSNSSLIEVCNIFIDIELIGIDQGERLEIEKMDNSWITTYTEMLLKPLNLINTSIVPLMLVC